ncbi:protein Star [Hyposmocoma kahamanoa]|uniref:protein Star n=1 Tax=Hyposmocoma kahamanoa TaxID=1477025 RepID=UPI000E6D7451|nr:protein Star [Hyposmocoma kahamanoa]
MAEKKIQENPLPEEQIETSIPQDTNMKPADKSSPPPTVVTPPRVPSFTKTSPNDMYRRLLPAVLFLLTFVTVMTMLLIYMDTVALGAQQFRLNMSRDYELARIPQESAPLVAYVRQLHLQPRAPAHPPPSPRPTPRVAVLDRLLGEIYNGTFVEFLPQGPRDGSAQFLEAARRWDGVVVRAKAKDYLALRGAARALHACLSPTDHPREVTYHESDSRESAFSSRVLCLPLFTVLLAADATRAHYVLLGGDNVVPALQHVPFQKVHLQVIEYFFKDIASVNATTTLLAARNYSVAAVFPDSIMYSLKP